MWGLKRTKKVYICTQCEYESKTLTTMKKHVVNSHFSADHCNICKKDYHHPHNHSAKKHISVFVCCPRCPSRFASENDLSQHFFKKHSVPDANIFAEIESAFNRRICTFQTEFEFMEIKNLEVANLKIHDQATTLIKHQLMVKKMIRFSLIYVSEYVKYDELGGISEELKFFLRSASKPAFLSEQKSIGSKLDDAMKDIEQRHEGFLAAGSGWVLNQIYAANLEIGKLSLAGGCNKVKFNVKPVKRKYLVDVETKGDECFFNSVALGFFSEKTLQMNPKKLGILAREYTKKTFNTKGLILPLNLKHIRKFELKNRKLNIRINVFTILNGEMIPVHKTVSKTATKVINIFLQQKKNGFKHHYIYISDLNKFLRSKDSKNHHCPICLNSFSNELAFKTHYVRCQQEDPVRIEYPRDDSTLSFYGFDKQFLQPLFGCCDFEASLVPVTRQDNAVRYNCQNCADGGNTVLCKHQTTTVHHQIPTTYSICIVDRDGKLLFEKTESDHINVMEKFFLTLDYIETEYIPLLQRFKTKSDYTELENRHFQSASVCHLCKGQFNEHFKSLSRVRDHCHYTNKYLGAAHNKCNFKRAVERFLPIFIHNFKNYDAQFILQGLKYSRHQGITGIPFNMEKFRTLNVGKVVFVDSFQLLPDSLNTLVSDLKDSGHSFPILDQLPLFLKYKNNRDLLLRKGVYPYEWATSIQKLIDSLAFPKRQHFFSSLSQKNATKQDYNHGKLVFSQFDCKNMLDYCHLYCRLDTLLLAEVITKFRKGIFEDFGLDCTKFISAPQLAFDCMLLTLKYPIELLTDPEMIAFFEKVRGGPANAIEREVSIPNYMKTNHGQHVDDKVQDQLLYIDANNLYSVAQASPMPVGSFAWCTTDELKHIQEHILTIPFDYHQGFVLEVDLVIPSHKHKDFESLPLLPEHKDLTYDDLSPFSKECLNSIYTKQKARAYRSRKLVTDVTNKTRYVLHYRTLQTCLEQGVVLTKIHSGIKFEQKRYLKDFIDKCTQKRKNATSAFDKMYYKLIMNSCYGKFLQNNRSHLEVKICTKSRTFSKHYNSPLYKGHRILSEKVVAVYLCKSVVKLDRLYATGFSILEIAKNHMYNSWYNCIQPALGKEKVNVVLTDTDSLLLHVKGMSRNDMLDRLSATDCMDFSNYPKHHPRYSDKHKSEPGYFKDESAGNYMTEAIALKAKCYVTRTISADSASNKEHIVCKGVTKAAREKLTLKVFRNVVKNIQTVHADMHVIRAKNHQLYTQRLKKVALSTADDKRYLKKCGIHTLPYGSHESIRCRICPLPSSRRTNS